MSGPSYQELRSFFEANGGKTAAPTQPTAQHYDMSQEKAVQHRFDTIVGNELSCSLHSACNAIIILPTEVLEMGEDGTLHLVDKAPPKGAA